MPVLPCPQTGRLKELRRLMAAAEVEAVLITSAANRRYYSGFEAGDAMLDESSGALLISKRGQYLLTDSRYTEAAKAEAPLFKVLTYRAGLGAELGKISALGKIRDIYVEPEFMTIGVLSRLKRALPGHRFIPLPFDPDGPRAVKSPDEIKLVTKALMITEAAVAAALADIKPGRTERDVAFFIEAEFRRLGAEGPSFETIVASGPNGALPHAVPGFKKIKEGEMVIIDCGAKYRGYCADITRTKIVGRPKPWQKEIYAIVRQAQLKAIAAIGPGVPASEVDAIARNHIGDQGYGEFFGHGLGHGVGLVIHEAPSLSPRNPRPLQPGEIVTVEPGIYLPGRGGVRLEQLVLVTDKGHKLLNRNLDFYDF
ncbi:Xaa-Pro peptidase family protein [Deltaproteobacteria bacterium OttesenSCG-928-K17]|nr:Xaa-Pro peptidase family protein [Deltaproteobacteria bacterium OttesenSCG-928-K17]